MLSMQSVSRVSRQTGVDLARDTLRNMILRGEITAGQRLTLTDVADRIGTSVTPVREALRDLAATGLVDVDARKGARVHAPTTDDITEIYELRMMLEVRAMTEVAALEEERRVVAAIMAGKVATQMDDEHDVADWAALNLDFHVHLTDPLRETWPVLYCLIESLRNRSMLSVATALRAKPALMQQANRDHRKLVTAIRNGDTDGAERVTTQYLGRTLKVLLKSYSG
ncbi:GntR family transcriptional regulator [Mycobacterium stomatepiae]|uniref:Transcriptional regulator n=1 Tax=Mycobacterium stomatepiae TaxID=470076 RepID=A0A7I7QIA1_9MYCO|nr:GntR family transcriptional regulator [Mycobacterium stomatepiae]BBY25666.1 transcriptional regulator [Mycobacterium stomatepiae]